MGKLFHGGVASKVLAASQIPVLVYKVKKEQVPKKAENLYQSKNLIKKNFTGYITGEVFLVPCIANGSGKKPFFKNALSVICRTAQSVVNPLPCLRIRSCLDQNDIGPMAIQFA